MFTLFYMYMIKYILHFTFWLLVLYLQLYTTCTCIPVPGTHNFTCTCSMWFTVYYPILPNLFVSTPTNLFVPATLLCLSLGRPTIANHVHIDQWKNQLLKGHSPTIAIHAALNSWLVHTVPQTVMNSVILRNNRCLHNNWPTHNPGKVDIVWTSGCFIFFT